MNETNGSEAAVPMTLEEARALLQEHTARINAEHYRIGRILMELVDRKQVKECSPAGARKELGPVVRSLSELDVSRCTRVARRFTEEVCVKYGMKRLSLLLEYARRLPEGLPKGDPGSALILVPGESGTSLQKPFAECSLEDLGRALQVQWPHKPQPVPRLEEYCVHLLREGVRKRFAGNSPVEIRAVPRGGKLHVTLKTIAVTELKMLAESILDSIVPLKLELYRRTVAQRPHLALGHVAADGPC